MQGRGYLKATASIASFQVDPGVVHVSLYVDEGGRYRWGSFRVTGNEQISSRSILEEWGEHAGQIADWRALQDFVSETLEAEYQQLGYIQYTGDPEPELVEPKRGERDGTVNISLQIDEGRRFKVHRIEFDGVTEAENRRLRGALELKIGDVYIPQKLARSIFNINRSGRFRQLDKDHDVAIQLDEESRDVVIVVRLEKLRTDE